MANQEETAELEAVREQILAAYVLYNGSVEQDDPAVMLAFYRDLTTEDFVECNKPGDTATTANKIQMLGSIAPAVEANNKFGYDLTFQATTHIDEVHMEGPKAIATLTHRFYIVERDQTDLDRWQETWVPTEAGWRLERKQRLEIVRVPRV
ncbi:MAG: hypothetical protein JWN14_3766 [Chthonomonadales bacterium]|nr:hypothetical protein [Chthonomonadales bacterium]